MPTRLPGYPKFGLLPNDPAKPRLRFAGFRRAGAVAPATADFEHMPVNDMLGNDAYGDCVFAANGHLVGEQTFYGQGSEIAVTTAQALAEYTRVTGFNSDDPSTDNGAQVQDGLNDLRKNGLAGHKIAAFAEVATSNMADVKLATAEFGAVDIGFDFPSSAMDQFNAGQPWDVVANDGGIEGGHCVIVLGYDAAYLYVDTWGAVQRMTYAFWDKYVSEAWAVVSADWVNVATRTAPTGVDEQALGAQYAALTGQPNPFPVPSPVPTPAPQPAPVPSPVPVPAPDPVDTALASAAERYLDRWLPGPAYLVKALRAWLTEHGN